jgi:hypothetical protein
MGWIGIAALLLVFPAQAGTQEKVLIDFDRVVPPVPVEAHGVQATLFKKGDNTVLRVASGHKDDWPGVTLKAPGGRWDFSSHSSLAIDVTNAGTEAVTVNARVDNEGADGAKKCNNGSVSLKPGERGVLQVQFARKPSGSAPKLFGMRGYPGGLGGTGGEGTIDPAQVTQILVFLAKPKADYLFDLDNIRLAGANVPVPEGDSFFPFIDTYGQYIHRDWPGKTHNAGELVSYAAAEAQDLAKKPSPSGWDEFGGWAKGPTLKATGFFHPEKHKGKWWLVDPKGKLFFSHGIDCVNEWGATPVDERQKWFQDIPSEGPFFSTGRVLHGHYAGRTVRTFDFIRANLARKYPGDWKKKTNELAHQRLRSWGLNTIANWSDPQIYLMRHTPYTATIHFEGKLLEGSQGYWGKFRDVFDPSFADGIKKRMAQEKGKSAGDPWCVGYFVDNEIAWGDDTSLALAALQSPAEQAAKKVFLEDLKAKHKEVGALNAAWGTNHASWEALASHRGAPDRKKAREDLAAFYTKTAETYFRVIRDAVKEVAPNNLYLGCRFAWVNDLAAQAAAKYCDVVSYNLYRRDVADFKYPGPDMPLIIGEFHFGALDRGMFHTGLVPVASQGERARMYASYVTGALRHPQFVGTHWFQYRDEPTTGRTLDEENYQIGFVDLVDTPYPETVAACREVGAAMYETRLAEGAK